MECVRAKFYYAKSYRDIKNIILVVVNYNILQRAQNNRLYFNERLLLVTDILDAIFLFPFTIYRSTQFCNVLILQCNCAWVYLKNYNKHNPSNAIQLVLY